MFIQQGDTILTKINEIPKTAKHNHESKILHHGATGNHHSLSGGAFGIYVDETNGNKYLDVVEQTVYSHEEHKPITLETGMYALSFVQEYDHFKDIQRAVID
jgi:hypothetical protein